MYFREKKVIDENDDDNVSLEEAKRFAADERNASPTRLAGDDWSAHRSLYILL
jgi:hypothetical protein